MTALRWWLLDRVSLLHDGACFVLWRGHAYGGGRMCRRCYRVRGEGR